MATHSSTLAWRIPWAEEPGRLQSMRSLRVRHDFIFTFTFHFHALEKDMATHSSVLPGESQGRGAWWAAVYGVAQSRTGLTRPSSSALRQRPPGPCTSSPSTIQATSAVPRGKPLLAAVATSRRFHHDRPEASHPPPPSLLRGCGCWPWWRP